MVQVLSYLTGRQHERARRWNRAAAAYEKALTGRFARIARWNFRLGFVYYKQQQWVKAARAIRKALALDGSNAKWHHRLGATLLHLKEFRAALEAFDEALAKGCAAQLVQRERAACFRSQGRWQDAEEATRSAIESTNATAGMYAQLADILRKQGKTWQELEALEQSVALDSTNPERYARIGALCEQMGDLARAVTAYQAAIALRETEPRWHFRLGHALQRVGRLPPARAAHRSAVQLDSRLHAKRLGIGVFYQEAGEWEEAAQAYAAAVRDNPTVAELHYRLGLALDRCYRWQAAAACYESAVALKATSPPWHARLGLVRERQGDWMGAAAAYEYAVQQNPSASDWFYRLGFVLCRAGHHESACNAFLASQPGLALQTADLPSPPTRPGEAPESERSARRAEPRVLQYAENMVARRRALLLGDVSSTESHRLLGCDYESTGDWAAAVEHYRAATVRAETHDPSLYYRLGAALAREGAFVKACDAFVSMRISQDAHGVPDTFSSENVAVQRRIKYTEFYEGMPLQDGLVLYESFMGASMSCNPFAVFLELRRREECKGWTHVWVLDRRDSAPQEFRNQPDVVFVARGSDAYLRYLASAKLLVNNVTFPEYFVRKPDQLYLSTWHGTPIKHLGKDIREELLSHKNVSRNFLHATHLISPNPHTTRVLLERYDVSGIIPAVVAETGYPRIDATVNATSESKALLRERLGVRNDQPVVLYAPTWRGTHDGSIQVDPERLERDIKKLRSEEYALLFRGHHLAEERLRASALADCTVPQDIDTNELLSIVDVLITDYSSIVFDFFVTGRSAIFYAYDLEEYSQARGLYFPLSELPGEICSTIEAVQEAVDRALAGILLPSPEAYRDARARYCPNEDGGASSRVIDLVLHDKRDGVRVESGETRTSLLFYVGPMMPNGILSSWKNLIAALDPERYVITIVIEPSLVSPYSARMDEFRAIAPHVQILGRANALNSTLEERWIMGKLHSQNRLAADEMMERYLRMFDRERRRIFGEARFDCVVNFEGYNRVWAAIFAGGGVGSSRRVIFLHNDMLSERTTRFPYLEGVFRLYERYDLLVSVSELTRDLNSANLAEAFGIGPEKFEYCENLQNPAYVQRMAGMPVEADELRSILNATGSKFVTVGRLSPEKDHSKLIRAFAALQREHPTVRLLIVGEGPLRGVLEALIKSLGLERHAFLLGHQSNPFPYVARCDCFVLSSNHEGQPMVLFEAMILGKPIVATNIVGARGVLEGRRGLLVDNSEAGLLGGMKAFLDGRIESYEFDNDEYQERVLRRFATKVVGSEPS